MRRCVLGVSWFRFMYSWFVSDSRTVHARLCPVKLGSHLTVEAAFVFFFLFFGWIGLSTPYGRFIRWFIHFPCKLPRFHWWVRKKQLVIDNLPLDFFFQSVCIFTGRMLILFGYKTHQISNSRIPMPIV